MDRVRAIQALLVGWGLVCAPIAATAEDADGRDPSGRKTVNCPVQDVAPSQPSWAPNSQELVLDGVRGGLRIFSTKDSVTRQLTGDAHDSSPEWSPVDDRIAYVRAAPDDWSSSDTATLLVARAGLPEKSRAIAIDVVSGSAVRWSKDGTKLLVLAKAGVSIVDLETGLSKLVFPRTGEDVSLSGDPLWYDEEHVLVEVREAGQPKVLLVAIDGKSTTTKLVTTVGYSAKPGGAGVLLAIGYPADQAPLLRIGDDGAAVVLHGPVRSYDVDAKRNRVVASVEGRGLVLADLAEGRPVSLTDDASDASPAWAHDGRSIAFVRRTEKDTYSLCVVRLE